MSAPGVIGLFGDWSGPTWWRLLMPFRALRKQGWLATPCLQQAEGDYHPFPAYAVANTVVLARVGWVDATSGVHFRDACHAAGKVLVYECDDDIFSPTVNPRMADLWGTDLATEEEARLRRLDALALCDGVTVTTPRLATILRQYTERPVEIVPNLIDWDWYTTQARAFARTTTAPCIGWAGGRRPDRDLAAMAEAWGRIARRYPHVQFYLQGWDAPVLVDAVPADRLTVAPWLPLDAYMGALANVDIGCCPLADEPFNHCKTPIKAWEYAAAGAAVVASPTVYGTMGADRAALPLASTADGWEAALGTWLEDAAVRRLAARRLAWRIRKHHALDADWHGQPAVLRWVGAWQRIRADYQRRTAGGRLWSPAGVA